ncbi:hypothetical protein NSK_005017 [Nannochloropsis salina CCMP1776]|uniref:GTP-binding protein n=1 Tax=Nannochloropsis salina CCMP1776 TaxID=1027361 RepID=A0A4D9CX35_9STRA|nr:hypothetical protein NSK_005017 [Nannochloropsis salina CCMP1776]|eukprot:TFJ83921.1 hypothetical protein NSK_005017 [Nannochloropsis salina CCMP1776]
MARDTMRLSPTLDVEHHHVRFLGNLVLNLWDCGGQDAFYESYFDSQRDLIFRSVEVLIYVFDVESADTEKDMSHFMGVLEAIDQYSPDAKLFVLIHKMDLVAEEDRESVFLDRQKMILGLATSRFNFAVTFFKTSIWDETLYKAWSGIVYQLVPNVKALEEQLNSLCEICGANEMVLFERATFLVIAHATHAAHSDVHRFEKISNIIKQFKLSCGKTQAQFHGMEVGNSAFTAYIDLFTSNTYIMVILSDSRIHTTTTQINVKAARAAFEAFVP